MPSQMIRDAIYNECRFLGFGLGYITHFFSYHNSKVLLGFTILHLSDVNVVFVCRFCVTLSSSILTLLLRYWKPMDSTTSKTSRWSLHQSLKYKISIVGAMPFLAHRLQWNGGVDLCTNVV